MKNKSFLSLIAIFAFMAIVFLPDQKKETKKNVDLLEKEVALAKQIDSLQCGDSLLIASEDYKHLLQNDSIRLGSSLFINNVYPRNDYLWRNSKSLYEVRLRNREIKIKRFCDPEMDEPTTN